MKDMGPSGLILFKAKVDLQWLIIMFVERKQRQALFLIWSLNQMTPWTVLETPLCCFVQFQGNCFGLPLDKLTYSYSYLSSQGHMLVLCYLASAQWWNQSKMNCWWRAKYYFLFFFLNIYSRFNTVTDMSIMFTYILHNHLSQWSKQKWVKKIIINNKCYFQECL